MRKTLLMGFCALFFVSMTAIAQKSTVTGKVTDDKGRPIDGASVVEKKSKNGTATDANGAFKLSVSPGAVLVVSGTGYERKEIATSSGVALTISLKNIDESLSEVVVTALGIKREKKALGYAVTSVAKKDIELRPEGDIGRVLAGKAPGVDILGTSGISGSGTNIVIRGVSTITGGSVPPLFIVDGVPFDGSTNMPSGFTFGGQTSSRFLDIDPNNIENITVLKGLSAAIQYGDLARNGVVLITTKNGSANNKQNKKTEITVSQSLFANKVANLPDYQDTYGGGFNLAPSLAFSNWGAAFKNPPDSFNHPYSRSALNVAFPEYKGKKYAYKAYNSVPAFFRTGWVSNTSVNVSGGNAVTRFSGNYSYTSDQGFLPGNSVIKNNFGFGGLTKLSNNFTLSGTINFATTDYITPTTSTSFGSSADNPSVYGDLIYTPRSIDLMGWPYKNPIDGSSVYYRANNGIQNPRWTVENSLIREKIYRTFGNIQMKYDIMKGLSVLYRLGIDVYNTLNELTVNKGGTTGGLQYTTGMYRTLNSTNSILDHNILVNYVKDLNEDWNLTLDGGLSLRNDNYTQNGMKSTQQLVFGLFNHGNFVNHEAVGEDGGNLNFESQQKRFGAFLSASGGYRNYLYLNVGGRESWVSTLEESNRKIFYPSASISMIPTAAINGLKNNKWVNFLKVRVGYSTSARFPDPYTTRTALNIQTNAFVDRNGNVINQNAIPNRLANPDLKPELLKEYEAGLEGTFINHRLTVDLTFYKRISSNQILDRSLDPSTGYTVTSVNAGDVRNEGIELGLGYNVVKARDWNWQLNANWTINKSLVYDLPSYIKQINFAGYSNLGNFAINGQPLGILQGSVTSVDPKTGQKLLDDNGYYVQDPNIGILGSPLPQYKLTGISELTWKSLTFRAQMDYSVGGKMISLTTASLLARGLTKDMDFDRTIPITLPGIRQSTGKPNDIQTGATSAYFNTYFGPNDFQVWDATLIRLREVSLSYSLPSKWLAKTPFGSVSVVASGQNLFYLAPNFPKYVRFDPETSSLGVGTGRGLELLTGPSSRRFGASIRVTF